MQLRNPKCLLEFMHIVSNLKQTKRTGWVHKGIPNPESISDHMYRMALLVMLIDDKEVDLNRCMRMAIVHDIGESIIGDYTPNCNITKTDKFKLEHEAIIKLCTFVSPTTPTECDIHQLWEEYELEQSKEAVLVKDLDQFEMILQAFEYEKLHPAVVPLNDFFVSTYKQFRHPQVVSWVNQLYTDRKLELGIDIMDLI